MVQPAPAKDLRKILHKNGPTVCVARIAAYLKLPVTVELSYVEEGADGFKTTKPAKSKDGRAEAIIAQVLLPTDLPLYGSSALKGFPIRVKIAKDATQAADCFIGVVAHELCHVLLRALRHKKDGNEIYTDLAAMILGFADIMRCGRTDITYGYLSDDQFGRTDITYGYLSDDQFEYAFDKITTIADTHVRAEEKFVDDLTSYHSLISAFEEAKRNIKKCLREIDAIPQRRVRSNDVPEIVRFHQPSYDDEIERTLVAHREAWGRFDGIRRGRTSYSNERAAMLRAAHMDLQVAVGKLTARHQRLTNDLSVVRRNVRLTARLKLFLCGG